MRTSFRVTVFAISIDGGDKRVIRTELVPLDGSPSIELDMDRHQARRVGEALIAADEYAFPEAARKINTTARLSRAAPRLHPRPPPTRKGRS